MFLEGIPSNEPMQLMQRLPIPLINTFLSIDCYQLASLGEALVLITSKTMTQDYCIRVLCTYEHLVQHDRIQISVKSERSCTECIAQIS